MNTRKFLYTLGGLIFFSLLIKLFGFAVPDDIASNQQVFNDKYYIFALNTPKNLSFAGEKVPVEQFDVRERLDRELLLNTYWQSQTMLFHKRANRWFPVITPILKRNGIPEDFKFLALAESGFTYNTSTAGAVGYWQFLDATAKNYGLEINDEVDERYNVERSTEAACKYFKEAYGLLGSWTLVAGSYNMGIGGIRKQVEKQRVKSYYDLLLNDETFRYLFRILALKEIVSKPTAYGYHFKKADLYSPYEYSLVVVDSSITNLVDFAEKYKINYKYLKLLNPWMRGASLNNKAHKPYTIKILKPGYVGFGDSGELIEPDTLKTGAVIIPEVQQKEVVTAMAVIPAPAPSAAPAPKEKEVKSLKHKVGKGESLNLIARKYDVSVENLKEWNGMKEAKIKTGQKLIIKVPSQQ